MRAWSGELRRDTRWEGEVLLEGDVVVPKGICLSVSPGTRVLGTRKPVWSCAVFRPAPEGYPIEATCRNFCDLIVLGKIEALGTLDQPVQFGDAGHPWGGVTWLGQGRGHLRRVHLSHAQEIVLQCFDDSQLILEDCHLAGLEVGLWTWGRSRVQFIGGKVEVARCGVLCCDGSHVKLREVAIANAKEPYTAEPWTLFEMEGLQQAETGSGG